MKHVEPKSFTNLQINLGNLEMIKNLETLIQNLNNSFKPFAENSEELMKQFHREFAVPMTKVLEEINKINLKSLNKLLIEIKSFHMHDLVSEKIKKEIEIIHSLQIEEVKNSPLTWEKVKSYLAQLLTILMFIYNIYSEQVDKKRIEERHREMIEAIQNIEINSDLTETIKDLKLSVDLINEKIQCSDD